MPAGKKTDDKYKRSQERLLKVRSGAAEMEIWLKDLLRAGLLQLPQKNADWFDHMRARMVDAQAPGLGNLVRNLKELSLQKEADWQSEAAHIIAKIFLLLEGIKKLERMDPKTEADVRYLSGWNVNQQEILDYPFNTNIFDHWLSVAVLTEMVEGLNVERNYLYGLKSGAFALHMNFAFRRKPEPSGLAAGKVFAADLTYVPSNLPLRTVIRKLGEEKSYSSEPMMLLPDFTALLAHMTLHRSKYPWVEEHPFAVAAVCPIKQGSHFLLKDREEKTMAIATEFDMKRCLNLLACTGGKPFNLFVLFSKGKIIPLGIIGQRRYVML